MEMKKGKIKTMVFILALVALLIASGIGISIILCKGKEMCITIIHPSQGEYVHGLVNVT